MSKVSVNQRALQPVMAEFISRLTKSETVGKTAASAVRAFGSDKQLDVTVNDGVATAANLHLLASKYPADSVVNIEDEGKNPNPRMTTWGAVIAIIEITLEALPLIEAVNKISAKADGLVKYDKTANATSGKGEQAFDFTQD